MLFVGSSLVKVTNKHICWNLKPDLSPLFVTNMEPVRDSCFHRLCFGSDCGVIWVSELKLEKVFKSLYIRLSDSADTRVEHAFGSVQRCLSLLQAGTCVLVGVKGEKNILFWVQQVLK